MKFRQTTIFTGEIFEVPTHIVRVDSNRGHAWQVRYGRPWKSFADHSTDGSGAARSLRDAKDELAKRISNLPAPTGLRVDVMAHKKTDLPVGISGPISRLRTGRTVPYYDFQVTLPIHGEKHKNRHVYIATENTLTPEKLDLALAKAISIRNEYLRSFKSNAKNSKEVKAKIVGVVHGSDA